MTGVLNAVYGVAVVLVAVAGLAFVFWGVGGVPRDRGLDWRAAVVAGTALFLTAIVVDLAGLL